MYGFTKEEKELFYSENMEKTLKLVSYDKQHFNYYLDDTYISVSYIYMDFYLDFTDLTLKNFISLEDFLDEDTYVSNLSKEE